MSEKLKKAAKIYLEASLALANDRELKELEAEAIDLRTKHVSELVEWQKRYDTAAASHIKSIEAAKAVLEPEILASKAGVKYGRLEALYTKGRKTIRYKDVSSDLASMLAADLGADRALEILDEARDRHTSTAEATVRYKIEKETKDE